MPVLQQEADYRIGMRCKPHPIRLLHLQMYGKKCSVSNFNFNKIKRRRVSFVFFSFIYI